MSKQKKLLEKFRAILNEEELARLDAFIVEFEAPELDEGKFRTEFLSWATSVLEGRGGFNPGEVLGAIFAIYNKGKKGKKKPEKLPTLSELSDAMPYPLGLKLRQLLQSERRWREGGREPQLRFKLCAVMGVLVRLAALIAIRSYVDAGGKDAKLNKLIVEKLRAPSDGGWLEVAQRVTKALAKAKVDLPVAALVHAALKAKPALSAEVRELASGSPNTAAALGALVKFRNDLVHGEPQSERDIERAMALLEVAVRGFAELGNYRLEVKHVGQTWSLNGAVPRPIEEVLELPEDEPCLVHAQGAHAPLSLSPLLRFRAGDGEHDMDVDFDELFFLNAGSLERLLYIGYRASGQVSGKALGSYNAFKSFISKIPTPVIPKNPRMDFSGVAEFHSRLFVGRSDVFQELTDTIRGGDRQYVVMKALAGMGKSAIFACLLQAFLNLQRKKGERIASPADGHVRADDHWVFHFCKSTEGHNSPTLALRSLIAQICDAFEGLDREHWLSEDLDKLKDEMFPSLLSQASQLLKKGQRLVVVIDALDEGMGAEEETIPSCIPAGQYPGVVFLLSYRVDEDHENSRVEGQLKHLEASRRPVLASANPLSGLTREDVGRYLAKVAALMEVVIEVPESTHEAVWAAAIKDVQGDEPSADPFYLRFVADGVQSGSIRLARAETVPESLDDAFEEMWMGLPQDYDFLCHRVLLTLGIMREYGDDTLFADLFNRERSDDDKLSSDDVAAVRINAGKLLVYDGDRYGLFHDRFRFFLVGEQKDPIAEALGVA